MSDESTTMQDAMEAIQDDPVRMGAMLSHVVYLMAEWCKANKATRKPAREKHVLQAMKIWPDFLAYIMVGMEVSMDDVREYEKEISYFGDPQYKERVNEVDEEVDARARAWDAENN